MAEKKYSPYTSKYVILFLAAVSIVAALWGVYKAADYALFSKRAESAIGRIEDVQLYYAGKNRKNLDAYVTYTVGGESYELVVKKYKRVGRYADKKEYIGQSTKILYDPQSPWKARLAEPSYSKSLFMIIVGAAAAGLAVRFHRKNMFYRNLFASGAVLDAEVVDVKHKTVVYRSGGRRGLYKGLTLNDDAVDRETFRTIVCVWTNPVTGQSYTFESCQVKEFVEPYIGATVRVYADPANYGKYFVDVDDLLAKPFVRSSGTPFTYGKNP